MVILAPVEGHVLHHALARREEPPSRVIQPGLAQRFGAVSRFFLGCLGPFFRLSLGLIPIPTGL